MITLRGAVKGGINIFTNIAKSKAAGAAGASATTSFFTQEAIKDGFLASTGVARNKAPFFAQIHNNIPRLFRSGQKVRTLFSSNAATTVGRQRLHNAYGSSLLNLGTSILGFRNDFFKN